MYKNVVKPLGDFIFAVILTILTLPIIILLGVLIKLDSSGPIIFSHKRVGKNCKTFPFFKLRTMVSGAAGEGPYFTQANDSRITRVGKFLRKSSLDELPQIWNVLLGQMSFIGVRPDNPVQKDTYESEEIWEKRHQLKPGITGLAASTLRSAATPEQRTSMDLHYVDNCSLILDLKIIFYTFRTVMFKSKVAN